MSKYPPPPVPPPPDEGTRRAVEIVNGLYDEAKQQGLYEYDADLWVDQQLKQRGHV